VPIVVRDGELEFVIHTRELPFEPPHVHVRWGGGEVRIELVSGTFMEEPPPGRRRTILDVFARNAGAIRRAWDRVHSPQEGDQA
jgi:hypothetical protein